MPSALNIARHFLWLAAQEPEPEFLTPMRLQKLLYYAQGWSLGIRGKPLFPEAIEAWVRGPVVRDVYRAFASCGNQVIPLEHADDPQQLSPDDRSFVASIWDSYKVYSATELRRMTHAEEPWRDARQGLRADDRSDQLLPEEVLAAFFQRQASQLQGGPGIPFEDVLKAREDFNARRSIPLNRAFPRAV